MTSDPMAVPNELHYTEEHEWTRYDKASGVCTIGITAFAQEQLGSIVYVELPDEGVEVSPGDSIGQIESTKSVSDLYAPMSGTVVDVNRALETAPELINSDPYEEGWIIKLQIEDNGELDDLMNAAEYKDHIGEEE